MDQIQQLLSSNTKVYFLFTTYQYHTRPQYIAYTYIKWQYWFLVRKVQQITYKEQQFHRGEKKVTKLCLVLKINTSMVYMQLFLDKWQNTTDCREWEF